MCEPLQFYRVASKTWGGLGTFLAMEAMAINLSLSSRLTRLAPLPGQGGDVRFGVVADGISQPEDGLGYVVRILGRRSVEIVAWIRRGMSLYATSAPLIAAPEAEPDLSFLRDPDEPNGGVVRLAKTGHLDLCHWHSDDRKVRYGLDLPADLIGTYATDKPSMAIRTMAAVAWIALVDLEPAFVDIVALAQMLRVLGEYSLPDALDILHGECGRNRLGRFLAEGLERARFREVRRICAGNDVEAIFLETTHLLWIRYDPQALPPEDQALLEGLEAALNRAILIGTTIMRHEPAPVLDERAYWDRYEREVTLDVLYQADRFFHAGEEENPRLSVFGTGARKGGEWDVRTRMALALEHLILPTRLTWRFDVDATRGIMTVEFAIPSEGSLPDATRDGSRRRAIGAEDDGAVTRDFRLDYALRLSVLLAASAFGTSVGLVRVRVSAFDGDLEGEPLLLLDLDRIDFVRDTLEAVRSGALARTHSALEFAEAASILPKVVGYLGEPGAAELLGLERRHEGCAGDLTTLPSSLQGLLRADVVDDLNVYGTTDDPQLKECTSIVERNIDTPLVAIMELEDLLARIDAAPRPGHEFLYCSSGTERLIVSIAPGSPLTRYDTVRDAVYATKLQLSKLYLQVGDAVRALEAAQDCVRLAPTSSLARLGLAEIYARLERFDETASSLIEALRLAPPPGEFGYVFYRLAFALWQTERVDEAIAAYLVAMGDPLVRNQAMQELDELRSQYVVEEIPTPESARAVLEMAGIPTSTSPELLEVLGRTVVGLTDAGIFDPTWQGLIMLMPYLGGDDMASVLRSLRVGTPRTA